MNNTINTKHARIILDIVRKNYKDAKFEITEVETISESIIEKAGIDVSKNDLSEYLNKFIYTHDSGKYYLNPDKRKKITAKKTIIKKDILDKKQELVVKKPDNIIETISDNVQQIINDVVEEDKPEEINNNTECYLYPYENQYDIIKKTEPDFSPFSSQWIHEDQVDDKLNKITEIRTQKFRKLLEIEYPEQRTDAWFKMREGKITASDIGTVIDCNKYEQQYKFIIKKIITTPFPGNKYVYHGKKFEKIATMIYEYRMNVKVTEFGLIGHHKYDFLGASPDGIIGEYKFNGVNKTALVGRMLEIKCPLSRKINKTGELIDGICPVYYYAQVLQQLECCDLDECDFWQCDIKEYSSRDEFVEDTLVSEPFRSKTTGYEKGVIIQLIPKDKAIDTLDKGTVSKYKSDKPTKYLETIWDHAQFIYPDDIEMTPYECDQWILRKTEEINTKPEYSKVFIDKVIYWKLNDSHCQLINRDDNWFKEHFPTMQRIWKYVIFFRKNKDMFDLFQKYIDSLNVKTNVKIMKVAKIIASKPLSSNIAAMKEYKQSIENINKEIVTNNNNKKVKVKEYCDDGNDSTSTAFNPNICCF